MICLPVEHVVVPQNNYLIHFFNLHVNLQGTPKVSIQKYNTYFKKYKRKIAFCNYFSRNPLIPTPFSK